MPSQVERIKDRHCLWACHLRGVFVVINRDWRHRTESDADHLAGEQVICSMHPDLPCGYYEPTEGCPDDPN